MERLKIKVNRNQANDPQKKKNNLTEKKAEEYIKQKGFSEQIEKELIKELKRQPNNTYDLFIKRLDKKIQQIERKLRKKENE